MCYFFHITWALDSHKGFFVQAEVNKIFDIA